MNVTARVKTGARTDSILYNGDSNEYLVSVKARPVEGEANMAIINLLSRELGVPKSLINLRSGAKSKVKHFSVG